MEANFPQLCQNDPLNNPFKPLIRCTECLRLRHHPFKNRYTKQINPVHPKSSVKSGSKTHPVQQETPSSKVANPVQHTTPIDQIQ